MKRLGIGSWKLGVTLDPPLRAGVVKLADAPDSKSGGVYPPCGFDSHLRHQPSLATRATVGGPGCDWQRRRTVEAPLLALAIQSQQWRSVDGADSVIAAP